MRLKEARHDDELHHLRPAEGAKTDKTRVGRGEGSKGKTAGRGTKGTKARKNVPARFEGGQMPTTDALLKLKGFTNRNRVEYQVVNAGDISLCPSRRAAPSVSRISSPRARSARTNWSRSWATAVGRADDHRQQVHGVAKEKIAAAGGTATGSLIRCSPGAQHRHPPGCVITLLEFKSCLSPEGDSPASA